MKKVDWNKLNEKVANSIPRKQGGRQSLTFRQIEEIKWKCFTPDYDCKGGLKKLAEEYNVRPSIISSIKTKESKGKGWVR